MKKYARSILLFLSFFLFSSFVSAAVLIMEGEGSTDAAVKTFNKIIASNGGTVDGNSVTEYSSAGIFGKYQAIIFSERVKNKLNIRITVKRTEIRMLNLLSPQTAGDVVIAGEIKKGMEKAGYRNLTPEENKKE